MRLTDAILVAVIIAAIVLVSIFAWNHRDAMGRLWTTPEQSIQRP